MDFIKKFLKVFVVMFGFESLLEVIKVNFMKHQCNTGKKIIKDFLHRNF